jgi:general secretion pathway protein C
MERPALAASAAGLAAAACWAWIAVSPAPQARLPAPPAAQPPVPAVAFVPATPSAAPPVSADGLILYGVSGSARSAAAIIGSRLGGQRVVAVGSDYRPGLRLAEVGVDYAILRSGAQGVRLELSRYGAGGSARPAAPLAAEEEQRIEAAVLRNILRPVLSGNRVGGYALKAGETLPQLIRAGLRPGDVLVAVNGSQLDEERMSELAWQMGNAAKTEFVFVRNGKRMRASV